MLVVRTCICLCLCTFSLSSNTGTFYQKKRSELNGIGGQVVFMQSSWRLGKKKEKRREKDVECPLSLSIKKIKNDAQSENSTFVCV